MAPVDVLALLDAYIEHGIPQERPDLQRARAAVAELIEADLEYDTARSRHARAFMYGSRGDFHEQIESRRMIRESRVRRAAALARVGAK